MVPVLYSAQKRKDGIERRGKLLGICGYFLKGLHETLHLVALKFRKAHPRQTKTYRIAFGRTASKWKPIFQKEGKAMFMFLQV